MEQTFKRFKQAVDYLKDIGRIHKQQDIADKLEMGKARISEALQGKAAKFTEGFVKRFASAYSDYINEDWLLTGEGGMIKVDRNRFRPHIPEDLVMVAASPMGTAIGSVTEDECQQRAIIPWIDSYDFTIKVKGESMLPVIMEGDILACRWIHDDIDFKPSKVYVLDTPEGAVVKRIKREGSKLNCLSDNPAFPAFEVAIDKSIKVAAVIGLVRNI